MIRTMLIKRKWDRSDISVGLAGSDGRRGVSLALGKDDLRVVQPQPGFALFGVRTVSGEVVLGEDRADVA